MKNENGYFVISNTDINDLSKEVAEQVKKGCKVVGDITTYCNPENGTFIYIQNMVEGADTDSEAIYDKFKKLVELHQSKEELERQAGYANKKYTELADARRSGRIESDSFKVLADANTEKNIAEKKLKECKVQFDGYSKFAIDYMKNHRITHVDNLDKVDITIIENGDLWLQKSR